MRTLLGALTLACTAVVLSGCAAPTLPDPVSASTHQAAPAALASQLSLGDCVNGSADTLLRDLTAVQCQTEHDYEVYAVFDIPESVYPGEEEAAAAAEAACASAFEPFVGVRYSSSTLDYAALAPDEKEWEAGDHVMACLVGDPAGPGVGSLSSSRR
jgi:Septum formation